MNNKTNQPESFWRPQILKHTLTSGEVEYAIHEVYYTDFGNKKGYTIDALSNRFPSVEQLKNSLHEYIVSTESVFICGDKKNKYTREDIELWLCHIDDPIINFEN